MAVQYNPGIVTDGLVLCLDAANRKSYPGSGTSINNLINSGNTGALINGVSFNTNNLGFFSFDGIDDYIQVNGSLTTSAATFICWIRSNGNQGQYDGILFSRSATADGMNFFTNNQLGYHWRNDSLTYNWNSGLIVPNLIWCMCAISISPTSATACLGQSSGITSSLNSVNHLSTTIDAVEIGRDSCCGVRAISADIALVSIYNRALTLQEIQQNFNALRGRFGI